MNNKASNFRVQFTSVVADGSRYGSIYENGVLVWQDYPWPDDGSAEQNAYAMLDKLKSKAIKMEDSLSESVVNNGDIETLKDRMKDKDIRIEFLENLLGQAAGLLGSMRCQWHDMSKKNGARCTNQATHFCVMKEGIYTYLSAHCDEHVWQGLRRQTLFAPARKDVDKLRIDDILKYAKSEDE